MNNEKKAFFRKSLQTLSGGVFAGLLQFKKIEGSQTFLWASKKWLDFLNENEYH